MVKLIGILGICFLLHSCSEEEKKESAAPTPEPDVETIDSSWYYDSINVDFKADIDQFFQQKIDARLFNGSFLYAQNGYIVSSGEFGIKNQSKRDSVDQKTAFQLASGSKPFTAIAILKLVEEGKIKLNDSLHHLVPDFPYNGITVEMLLNHKSGLFNYIYSMDYLMKDSSGYLFNESLLKVLQDTLPARYYAPNTKHEYCNTNYALLATVVERVSGKTFQNYMDDTFFKPLGMSNTFVIDKTSELPENAAIGYVSRRYLDPGNDYLNGVVGDKGLYSTAHDMLKFDQALYQGFINDSLVELSMQAHTKITQNKRAYGYGWRLINPESPEKIVYHTGWWQGFRTFFIRYPKEKKTVIVLDNVDTKVRLGVEELLGLFTDDY